METDSLFQFVRRAFGGAVSDTRPMHPIFVRRRKIEGIAKVGRNRDAARASGSRIALAPSSPGEARDWRTPQSVANLTPLLLAYEREREERRNAEKVCICPSHASNRGECVVHDHKGRLRLEHQPAFDLFPAKVIGFADRASWPIEFDASVGVLFDGPNHRVLIRAKRPT